MYLSMVLSVKYDVELHNAMTLYYRYHFPTQKSTIRCTVYIYYCGLKVTVGRKYCGPMYVWVEN